MLPREKALNYGINSLNNEELLALIIKSGHKDNNVFNIAKDLIAKANGFYNLLSLTYEELVDIKGIKKAKALEILAILEIAKRLSSVDMVKEEELSSPGKVVDWLKFNIGFSDLEEFLVIFLNAGGKIIKSEILFKGSKNKSIVAIDEVMRKAILLKSSGIVVCHNHPSGNEKPSSQDIVLTEELRKACEMMSIKLLDHIIVTKSSYYSFKQSKLLW